VRSRVTSNQFEARLLEMRAVEEFEREEENLRNNMQLSRFHNKLFQLWLYIEL
jgi:hypothetical protein